MHQLKSIDPLNYNVIGHSLIRHIEFLTDLTIIIMCFDLNFMSQSHLYLVLVLWEGVGGFVRTIVTIGCFVMDWRVNVQGFSTCQRLTQPLTDSPTSNRLTQPLTD